MADSILSMSANSSTDRLSIDGSVHTPVRAPTSPNATSPAPMAMRYEGMARGIENEKVPGAAEDPLRAAITAFRGGATCTVALYVTRTAGLSWQGIHERAWMACDWLYM